MGLFYTHVQPELVGFLDIHDILKTHNSKRVYYVGLSHVRSSFAFLNRCLNGVTEGRQYKAF